jgi:hypothetical protein
LVSGEFAVRSLDGLLRLPVVGDHGDRGAGHHPGHGRGVVHRCGSQPAGVVRVLERPGRPVRILAWRHRLVLELFWRLLEQNNRFAPSSSMTIWVSPNSSKILGRIHQISDDDHLSGGKKANSLR